MEASDLVIWAPKKVRNAVSLEALEGFEDEFELSEGVPLAARFPEDALFRMDPELPDNTVLTDNLVNKNMLVVASRRLKELLERFALEKVEYLPVTILDHRGRPTKVEHFIVHPLDPVDALDADASGADFSPIDDTVIDEIEKLVLDEDELDPKRRFFRLQGLWEVTLVHREIAAAIDKAGFTGVRWIELDSYPEG